MSTKKVVLIGICIIVVLPILIYTIFLMDIQYAKHRSNSPENIAAWRNRMLTDLQHDTSVYIRVYNTTEYANFLNAKTLDSLHFYFESFYNVSQTDSKNNSLHH